MTLPARPFTLAELPALGLTERTLRTQVASGEVRRILRGVYGVAALDDSLENRIAAAALVTNPGHVVIDRSAAWLHGVDAFGGAELEAGPAVETCALPLGHRAQRDGVRGHERSLSADDILALGPVRVTTPLRTALDLGCHLRRREAYAAMCELARLHELTVSALTHELPRFAGRRGVVQLRQLAPLVDSRFESPREAWTFLAIHDAGLPHPVPQFWIAVDGVPTYRLDLAYPLARVCVEYDGVEAHDSEEQRRADRERRAWLREHGWTVILVRLGGFTGDALDTWLRELRGALATPYSSRRW